MADVEEEPSETCEEQEQKKQSISDSPISKMFERQLREKGYIGEPYPDFEEEPEAENIYKAHWIKVKTPRLKIRYKGGRDAPAYHDLINVKANLAGTKLELVFDCMMVRICGKNLLPIADAIENHVCHLILEFNPERFPRPAPDKPIIDKISFSPVKGQEDGEGGKDADFTMRTGTPVPQVS